MGLFFHGCTSYLDARSSVVFYFNFFWVFQFFSKALTGPAARHCSVLFHLSLALTRFNLTHCSVFSTFSPPFLPSWAASALSRSSSPLFRLLILALCRSLSCCASDQLYLKVAGNSFQHFSRFRV